MIDMHLAAMNKEGECFELYRALYNARWGYTMGYEKKIKIIPVQRSNGQYNLSAAYGVKDDWLYIRVDAASHFEHRALYNHEAAHQLGHGLDAANVNWLNWNRGTDYTPQPDQAAWDVGNRCL